MRLCVAMVGILAVMAQAGTERFGIFAGHNLGRGREDLRYAERDAGRVAAIFREIGGMKPQHLRVLEAPSRAAFQQAIRDLEARARGLPPGVESVFFLYFSGHGDEKSLILGDETLSLDTLKLLFDGFPAKLRIGLFDACQSGAITRIKGAKVIEPFVHSMGLNGEGSIYITSSSGDENSQEADHLEASFFTHHLASGLRGAADASGDKRVTVMEAYHYAFNHTVAETGGTRGGTQHPNARFRMDVEGDVVLTDLGAGNASLKLGKGSAGEYLILDRKHSVMAEVNKDGRTEVLVALEPGRYSVFKKEGRKVGKAELELVSGRVHVMEERELTTLKGTEGKVKGWAARAPVDEPPEPVRPRVGVELGIEMREGPRTFSAGLTYAPFRNLAFLGQYSVLDRDWDDQWHQLKGGFELFLPYGRRLESFARASLHLGRTNDDKAADEYLQRTRFTCLDSDGKQDMLGCEWWQARSREGKRSLWGASLEVGGRFYLAPRIALAAGLAIEHIPDSIRFYDLEIAHGWLVHPFLMKVQAWF